MLNSPAVRKGFEDLELVIVQDIFMTKLPLPQTLFYRLRHGVSMKAYSPRLTVAFQRFFKAVEPKWDLKTDWQIISEIATRMGYPCTTTTPGSLGRDLRHLCPDFYSATYEKMGELGYIQWPPRHLRSRPGTSYLFKVRHPERHGAVLHLRLGSANRQTHWGTRWCCLQCVKSATTLAVR